MTTIEILLSCGATAFGAGVTYAVWRTLPNPDDAQPDLEAARRFIASTPQEDLRRVMAPKADCPPS